MKIYLYKAKPGSFEEPAVQEEKRSDYVGQEFFCSLDKVEGLEAVRKGSEDWLEAAHLARRVWGYGNPIRSRMSASLDTEQLVKDIRSEADRRIFDVAPIAARTNLSGAAAAGLLDEAQMSDFTLLVTWVSNVLRTAKSLADQLDSDFQDDDKWPVVPDSAAELAAAF